MAVRIFKAYRVRETTDDRGGLGAHIGFFLTKAQADKVSRGQGWYGGDARVSECQLLEKDDRLYLLDASFPSGIAKEFLNVDVVAHKKGALAAAKAKAKELLTDEERKLLGVED